MSGQFKTSAALYGPLSRILYGINRKFWLDGEFDSEVDGISIHVLVDSDSAVISFVSFSDALHLFRSFARFICNADDQDELYSVITEKLNFTVYLQSRMLGCIGPHSNGLVSRIFVYVLLLLGRQEKP